MKIKNSEFADAIRGRTKKLAIAIIQFQPKLPNKPEGWIIGKQLIRSATSVAANYRATSRARSKAEFFHKLSITVEESDETCFWLELIIEAEILPEEIVAPILKESIAITKILASARRSLKQKK